jgi:uncharacterized membrane protein
MDHDLQTLTSAKRPRTVLAGPYGHPLHPALVAIPIGAWMASFAFDLASYVVPNADFLAEGSRWLIAIGVLGALAAAALGFLDLSAIPRGTRAFRIALLHMSLNLTVTVLYVIDFVLRLGRSAAPVPLGPVILSAVALAALTLSGYLGGELAYRYGVRVADEGTQASGYAQVNR